MLNKIWPIFLIISFIYAFISGNLPDTNKAIFSSVQDAVTYTITLIGTMCLWCGITKIAMETSLINNTKKILKPLLKLLFPELDENDDARKEISMNIITNILGLGNAATPLGLKAMESLQKKNKNKDELSNSMIVFIVLNTASIQLIPTTVIAIRNFLNSENPTQMLIPVWIATFCAAFAAIISAKIFIKRSRKI